MLLGIGLLVVISGWLSWYTSHYQAVTLWAGKMIAPTGFDSEVATGFQDAITPSAQNLRNYFNFGAWLAVFILGSFIAWYLGVVSLILTVLVKVILDRIKPQTVDPYLLSIVHSLNNREADYLKQNDALRAEAAHAMSEKVQELYWQYRGKNYLVPDIGEVAKMKNQG